MVVASNQDESNAQQGFEEVIEEKTKKNKVLQGMVTDKSAQKAEKSQQLAENEQLLEATQAQLKEDEEFFEIARTSCKDKSDSWDERSRLRTEELSGINKALEILTSDDARATFQSAHDTRAVDTFGSDGVDVAFVQLSAEEEASPQGKAYRALKKVLKGKQNLMLARLAATVRASTTGHFDEVIGSIDTMLQTLKDEEAEDIKQRDWCIEERHTERSNRDDLEYDIAQLQAKIERAENKKKGLEKDVETTEKAKEDLEDDMAQALEDRTAENQNFHDAKEDDLKAVDLLADAIAAMSGYAENNLALLQKSSKKQPEFEVSEDQAPDATFSDSDKHKGATDGIVALLTQIKENLENEVGPATKAEAKATEEYDALKASSEAQVAAYDTQLTDLAASIADTDAEIEADTNTSEEHTATLEYLGKIKPNCDWIEGAFTKRGEARKQESEGLQQAKAILAGSEGGEFGFLQRK